MRKGRTKAGLVLIPYFLIMFLSSLPLSPQKGEVLCYRLLIWLIFVCLSSCHCRVFDRMFCLFAILCLVNILCLFCSLTSCCYLEAYCIYTYLHLSLWWSRCSHIYMKYLYIVSGCVITVLQNTCVLVLISNLVRFLQYTYFTLLFTVVLVHIWIQGKLILIIP